MVACVAGRREGVRKVKMSAGSEASVLALHALVFPLSLPFGRLPRRLQRVWSSICFTCVFAKSNSQSLNLIRCFFISSLAAAEEGIAHILSQ